MAENNNFITRNLRQNGALPYKTAIKEGLLNNELLADGYLGVQGALREIIHRGVASACIITESTTGDLAPSGTYDDCDVASGYILTKNSNGLSRLVLCAAITALNITATTSCIVASNDGVISVKAKTSVLSTDVIIALRSPGDNALVDVRNFNTEDDILAPNLSANSIRVVGNMQVYKVGVDTAGKRTIVLKDGDDLSDAVTVLGGAGTIILLPGTYTDNITLSNATKIIGIEKSSCIISGNVTMSASTTLQSLTVTGSITVSVPDCFIDDCIVASVGILGTISGAGRIEITGTKISAGIDASTINTYTATLFLNISRCIMDTSGRDAISVDDMNVTIANCRILNTSTYASITVSGSGTAVISGNIITSSGACSGNVVGSSRTAMNYVLITGNVISHTNASQCVCIETIAATIVGNTVTRTEDGNTSSGILCTTGIVSGNTVIMSGTSYLGIIVGKTSDPSVVNNNHVNCVGNCTTGITAKLAVGNYVILGGTGTIMDTTKKHANYEDGTYQHGDIVS